jgi:hypothetical protein
MPITTAMATSFKVDILSGGHNFNTTNRALSSNTQDSFKIALYTSTATYGAATTAYSSTNEITNTAGSAYSAGGLALTISQVPIATGTPNTTAYIDFADSTWSSASFTANGAMIYNTTNSNKTVATLSFGGDKTVTSGTFTIQYPAPGTGSSIIQIA